MQVDSFVVAEAGSFLDRRGCFLLGCSAACASWAVLLLLWFRENRGGGQAGSSISECLYFYTRGAALGSTANGFSDCARLISLLPASVISRPLPFFFVFFFLLIPLVLSNRLVLLGLDSTGP